MKGALIPRTHANRPAEGGVESEGEGKAGAEAEAKATGKGAAKGGKGTKSKGKGGRGSAQELSPSSLSEGPSLLPSSQSPLALGSKTRGFCAVVRRSGRFHILDLPSGIPLFQSPPFSASPLLLRHSLGTRALSTSGDAASRETASGDPHLAAAGAEVAHSKAGTEGTEGNEGERGEAQDATDGVSNGSAEGGQEDKAATEGTTPSTDTATPPAPSVPPPVVDLALASLDSTSGAPFLVALLSNGALVCYKAHLGRIQSHQKGVDAKAGVSVGNAGAVAGAGGREGTTSGAGSPEAGAGESAPLTGSSTAPGPRLFFQRVKLDHLRCPSPDPRPAPAHSGEEGGPKAEEAGPGRRLIPFESVKGGSGGISGLFVTGERPLWLMCLRQRVFQHLMVSAALRY